MKIIIQMGARSRRQTNNGPSGGLHVNRISFNTYKMSLHQLRGHKETLVISANISFKISNSLKKSCGAAVKG